MEEIALLRTHAVACRTGVGRMPPGEGLSALIRAFFYAGARAVIATLGDVDDRSTADSRQTTLCVGPSY
jgi:hypothetical protein